MCILRYLLIWGKMLLVLHPSIDSAGHGQLLNGAKTDLLLDLLSQIVGIFMVNSRDKTNLEGFPALLQRQKGYVYNAKLVLKQSILLSLPSCDISQKTSWL